MLLNPEEHESNAVITELTEFTEISNKFSPGDEHDTNRIMEIFKKVKENIQLICKAEWEKIKEFK
ncbi:TPA: hypothetical protein SMM66_000717 [Proteus mirabilis]|nr:hypothetical protein [Proteus mirabilis]